MVGAVDAIVYPDSAKATWGNENVDVVVDRGHINLVKPEEPDDLAFLALRNLVNKSRTLKTALVLTHGQLDWSELRQSIERVDPGVKILVGGGLLQHAQTIDRARVLILPLPHKHRFSSEEIDFVKNWVDNGGGLLLMGYYAADRHHEDNVSDMARAFGYMFADNLLMPPGSVYDDTRNQPFSMDSKLAVKLGVSSKHEIAKGVTELAVLSSCAVLSAGAATPDFELNTGNSSSTWVPEYVRTPRGVDSSIKTYREAGPESVPVAVAFKASGRVVIIGTWKLFTVDVADNRRFVRNTLDWLAAQNAPQ